MNFDFETYLDYFNNNSERALVEKYFTEDCVIELTYSWTPPDGLTRGREAWVKMLEDEHSTEDPAVKVIEVIKAIDFVQNGSVLMAELEITYVCSIDQPNYELAPLKANEPLTFKMLGIYHLRDQQIERLKLAWWPDPVTPTAK